MHKIHVYSNAFTHTMTRAVSPDTGTNMVRSSGYASKTIKQRESCICCTCIRSTISYVVLHCARNVNQELARRVLLTVN